MSRPRQRNGISKDEFLGKLRPNGECWEWSGGKDLKGYGTAHLGNNKYVRANRLAYTLLVGEFDKSLHILHSCDNKLCCNPSHLRTGSNAENMREKADRARISSRKFDKDKIRIARDLVSAGHSKRSVARKFGVTPDVVNKIISGKTYYGSQYE